MKCPYCGEEVDSRASGCSHCGRSFDLDSLIAELSGGVRSSRSAVEEEQQRQYDHQAARERRMRADRRNRVVFLGVVAVIAVVIIAIVVSAIAKKSKSSDGENTKIQTEATQTEASSTSAQTQKPTETVKPTQTVTSPQSTETTAPTETTEPAQTTEPDPETQEPEPGENEPEETPSETPDESEYVLPDSDKRYYEYSELENLSQSELLFARNEIYARHGWIFTSKRLADYFESKSWYKGTTLPGDFDYDIMNEYETANVKLLLKVERDKGY